MIYDNIEELYVFKNLVCTNIGNFHSFVTINFTYFKAENPNQNRYITLKFDNCIISREDKHNYSYKLLWTWQNITFTKTKLDLK